MKYIFLFSGGKRESSGKGRQGGNIIGEDLSLGGKGDINAGKGGTSGRTRGLVGRNKGL